MRLACDISNLCNRFGDEKVLEMFHKVGFECIDYSFNEIKPLSRLLGEDYLQQALKLKNMLEQFHVICNQTHAPFEFRYGEAMDCSGPHYRDIVRAMEMSSILGAPRIIIHAVTTPDDIDIYEYNRIFYRSFLPYCEKFGIEVAVENIGRGHTDEEKKIGIWKSAEDFCEFIQGLESPWFCACVDIGHAAVMNGLPEDFIRSMDPALLKALHVHDTDFVNDCHALPYLQRQNWDEIMRALAQVDYQGDLNLEVLLYTERFPDELVVPALRFAENTGRYLIKKFAEYKGRGEI